jgi:sugar phosphate isomerase/epimerase
MLHPMTIGLFACAAVALAAVTNNVADQNDRTGEFRLSVQAWSFNHFSAFEAIDKTAEAGAPLIEFFPGQQMVNGEEGGVGPEMGDANTDRLLAHLREKHVKAVAFGVTGISRDENEARKLFTWAKKMGLDVINTESTDAIDTIEKMVKEFNIKVGFHNHPKRADDANYKMWDPNYVLSVVRNRDKRIGSCADTGHWVRSGIKPVDALRILKGRVMSSHLKDLDKFGPDAHDVPFGTGVSDMAGILRAYKAMGFNGPGSVEYEYNWDTSVPEIAQCVGFVRGFRS